MWRRAAKSGAVLGTSAVVSYSIFVQTSSPIALEKKKKRLVARIPPKYSPLVPGLYAWGNNKSTVVSSDESIVRNPTRIEYFDGKLLRDLYLSGDAGGVAVLDNGDVVRWVNGSIPQIVLRGKNIHRIQVSNGLVYGISKGGKNLYSWKLDREPSPSRGWLSLWGSADATDEVKIPNLGRFEHIKDFKTGNEHIILLTSKGRVYTGSTGIGQPAASEGQFGIASMSQFDPAPEPGVLHEVKMLKNREIDQIAAGENHSLVKTKDGIVFGFGDNKFGQVGVAFSYRNANVGVPTPVKLEKFFDLHSEPRASRIAAGGNVSYVAVDSKTVTGETQTTFYSFGNGLAGQLGTNKFLHAEANPTQLKSLAELKEYDEKNKKMVQIGVDEWTVGPMHAAISLKSGNVSEYGEDALFWGGNEFSQLGTGKRNNLPLPTRVPPLEADRSDENAMEGGGRMQLWKGKKLKWNADGVKGSAKVDQVVYAGDGMSAVYYRRA